MIPTIRRLLPSGLRRENVSSCSRFATTSSSRIKSIRFYRMLLRQCAELRHASHEHRFLIQPSINLQHEGLSSLNPIHEATVKDVFHAFLHENKSLSYLSKPQEPRYSVKVFKLHPGRLANKREESESDSSDDDVSLVEDTKTSTSSRSLTSAMWCHSHPTLKDAIRKSFHAPLDSTAPDQLLPTYQLIASKRRLWHRTVVNVQDSVRITAVAQPMSTLSSNRVRYGYRIRVENLRETETIKLLGRSWDIKSKALAPLKINAETGGCVGVFPSIEPGYVFEYQSSAEVQTEGTMQGRLHFTSESQGKFSVVVPPFLLQPDT